MQGDTAAHDDRIEALAETFEMLGDWEERYRYLIELGRKLPPLPDDEHNDANKVNGCMSQVWLQSEALPGPPQTLRFLGDSDAHIVKGLIALLFEIVSGRTPQQILDTDVSAVFTRLGLENHITMNRRNGFYSMVERIRRLAASAAQADAR
ncbi:Cysteine desulfuration protein SufE [Hydrocarboniphaga daqingensis]|jgi:cysteine desulfuration protein SufE|uniref:Cysteine desulfuration protein SufE n=1 Tax=Hydrocarboniphaga daqingensis TaxID=490188 RepID=A0A1M5LB12_9GAMM|nr:SufE family protein [Hydrocarboniphaga daqingensis]SHG62125.1 Cysteine desulfuration protein SufE [Hydrocarboniphaga daqingensis]